MAWTRSRISILLQKFEEDNEVLIRRLSDGSDGNTEMSPTAHGYDLSNSESSLMLDDQRHSQGLDERHGCQNSLQMKRRQLRASELRMEQAQQMMRQLVINIRMEKQLINQLVQTSKLTQEMNQKSVQGLRVMEQEAQKAQSELHEDQEQIQEAAQKMQCQQEECDHFTSLEMQSERHLHELENNLELMRRQYTVLEQKLWENAQHKLILDSEIHHMEKKQQQDLQQVQVSSDGHGGNLEDSRFDGQQHWLDREVEKALEQRYELGELHQSMVQQEEELIRREALLQEMEQLRIKCNQSSQDEHYMLELHKAIEALDTTIACRNEVLGSRQTAPRDPTAVLCQSWDNIMGHLASLTIKETQHLLCKYFDKVVLLQEEKRYLELSSSLLEVKAEEREQLVAELQVAIQNLSLENERKLTVQQSEHECSLQLFMNDASTAHTLPESGKSEICAIMQSYEDKVQELQKELVFYKCTNRELKCKLQKTLPESRCSQRASTRLPGPLTSGDVSLGDEVQPDRSELVVHGREDVNDIPLSSSVFKSNMAVHSPSVSRNKAISHVPPLHAAPLPVRSGKKKILL